GVGESFNMDGFNDDEAFNYPTDALNSEKDHLAGSNHIEWFTNLEINSGEAFKKGLLVYDNTSVRPVHISYKAKEYEINKQIGRYKITNPSGVTYHYSLPVYAFDEHTRSEGLDKSNGLTYRESTNL